MAYMLDTNIFNKLLDGVLGRGELPTDQSFVATQVQIREINRTNDEERRARLFVEFFESGPQSVPTETFVWGKSKWGDPMGDGKLFKEIWSELDRMNKSKPSNEADALIAETCIVKCHILLTCDRDLAAIVDKHGGKVVFYDAKKAR